MSPRVAILVAFIAIAAAAPISSQAAAGSQANARAKALMALAQTDPELANHFGVFSSSPVTLGDYGGKLVAAANVITALTGRRTTPEALNELASREKLYTENLYGALVCLDGPALAKLLSIASGGRFAVSLDGRVAGRVPGDEALAAQASPDLFVMLAYLDHTPMIEKSIAWTPEGEMARVEVVNPLAASGGPVPFKSLSVYDPTAFDSWEFYRFRKLNK